MADRPYYHGRPILPPNGDLDECVEEDGESIAITHRLKTANYMHDLHAEKHDSALESSIDSLNVTSKRSDIFSSENSNFSPQGICRDFERKLKLSADSDGCDSGVGLDSQEFSVHDSGLSTLWEPKNSFPNLHEQEQSDGFVLAYLEDGVSPEQAEIYDQDEDGDTQLHMAIIQLVKPVATYMISKSPNYSYVNLMNLLRQTPLHLAVITNQPDIVRQLMVAGGQVDRPETKGNTPLHIASKEGFWECVEALTRPMYHEETVCNAYKIPFHRIPQDLEMVNYEGQTCLHLATDNYLRPNPKQSYLRIVQHLLYTGADVNAADGKSGRTILHYTAEHGNMELLSLILKQPQLDLNARTYAGKTPMMLAIGRGFHNLARTLYDCGAEVPPYVEEEQDSSEDMSDEDSYDDICIGGEPVQSPR